MFLDKKKGNMAITETYSQQNLFAQGTTITGDIVSSGDFRVDGTIQGNLKTPGKVVIGKSGIINGTLKAANADIEGKFSGKLMISDTLSLKTSAWVDGEVEVGKLAVEPGASFNATCIMKGSIKELNKDGAKGRSESEKEQSA